MEKAGNVTRATLKLSKDNVIFAVRAVDGHGHPSLPIVPLPERAGPSKRNAFSIYTSLVIR